MVTAVGFNSPATCAALRAGVRNVNQTNIWDAESGTYLAAGKVPLPQWSPGTSKLADLVAPAICECIDSSDGGTVETIPILLVTASHDRPVQHTGIENLTTEIEHRLNSRLHPASRVIAGGPVGTAVALRYADALLGEGRHSAVIIAAVDSLLHHRLLDHYLLQRRLLTPLNSNGFSPGEAGAAVLVVRADRNRGDVLIAGIGVSREVATIESDEPLRAEGMTRAIREAFGEAHASYDTVQYRIADLNGEHYKFKEMTLAMMRFARKPKPKLFDLWHPIEYIGDVGAAIGPIVLGWALDASRKGYGVGPNILCTFGNDGGERAAVVLSYGVG